MKNTRHTYKGVRGGRGARTHSKVERGGQIIDLQRLEELLGKDRAVTEPPPPQARKRMSGRMKLR